MLVPIQKKKITTNSFRMKCGRWYKFSIDGYVVCVNRGFVMYGQPPQYAKIRKIGPKHASDIFNLFSKFSMAKTGRTTNRMTPVYYQPGDVGVVWYSYHNPKYYIPIQEVYYDMIQLRWPDSVLFYYPRKCYSKIVTSLKNPLGNGIVGVVREYRVNNVHNLPVPFKY